MEKNKKFFFFLYLHCIADLIGRICQVSSLSQEIDSFIFLCSNFRFPRLVDELFDRALPYVMWARGSVAMATEMFHNLVSKEKRGSI